MDKADQKFVANKILKMVHLINKHLDRELDDLRRLYAKTREPILKAQIVTQIRAVAGVNSAIKQALNEFHRDGEGVGVLTPMRPMPFDGHNSPMARNGRARPTKGANEAHLKALLNYIETHPGQTFKEIVDGIRWDVESVNLYFSQLEQRGLVRGHLDNIRDAKYYAVDLNR